MAKYVLSRNVAGVKTIGCAILDENCLADTYTVQFENGIIKNVDKTRVRDLDKLDEGVLSKLKEVGSKLFDRIIASAKGFGQKVGNFFAPVGGMNLMLAMNKLPFITRFTPGSSLVEACEEAGIEPMALESDGEETADKVWLKNANAMWKRAIEWYEEFQETGEVSKEMIKEYDEMMGKWAVKTPALAESYRSHFVHSLNEAYDLLNIEMGGLRAYNTNEMCKLIRRQYTDAVKSSFKLGTKKPNDRLFGFVDLDKWIKDNERAPYMLWGAPGVGKSQVVSSVLDALRDSDGEGPTVVSVNVLGMRKDDWSFPAIRRVPLTGSYNKKTGDKTTTTSTGLELDMEILDTGNTALTGVELDVNIPVDCTKAWLPCWDAEIAKELHEKYPDWSELEIEMELDNIANGGHMEVPAVTDDDGNVIKEAVPRREGEGGIIFIDELSRVDNEVMMILMTLVQSRTINGSRLGSRWIFVAAGNRFGDMGDELGDKASDTWEKAYNDRFHQVAFCPTVEEWLEWAPGHIHQSIIDFIKTHKDMWYAPEMAYRDGDKNVWGDTSRKNHDDALKVTEKSALLLFPNPRAWQQFSKELTSLSAPDDSEDVMDMLRKRRNPNYVPSNKNRRGGLFGREVTSDMIRMAGDGIIGQKATKAFADTLKPKKFTKEYANYILNNDVAADTEKTVEVGVPIRANAELLGIDTSEETKDTALGTIFQTLQLEYPKQTIITANQLYNITSYVATCISSLDDTGSTVSLARKSLAAIKVYIDRIYGEDTYAKYIAPCARQEGDEYYEAILNLESLIDE